MAGDSFSVSAASQNPLIDLVTAIKIGNQNAAQMVKALQLSLAAQSAQNTALAISYSVTVGTSGCTLVAASTVTYCIQVSVTTPATGTTAGKLFDSPNVANAGSSNVFALIPSSGTLVLNWPIKNGLVVQPSSQGQTVAVSYI